MLFMLYDPVESIRKGIEEWHERERPRVAENAAWRFAENYVYGTRRAFSEGIDPVITPEHLCEAREFFLYYAIDIDGIIGEISRNFPAMYGRN
jgi:hypothetical protein